MDRESLEKKKKEELIEIILDKEDMIKKLNDELYIKNRELSRSRFEEYIYDDYVCVKEQLEQERVKASLNDARIEDLNELLERYKNIVDKLGGNKYLD